MKFLDYPHIIANTAQLNWRGGCLRIIIIIVIYLTSSCVIWAFFGMSGPV
jgi:hypothetical protein